MEEEEIARLSGMFERRLPSRALHFLSGRDGLPFDQLVAAGIDDASINRILRASGVDIGSLIRVKIAAVLATAEPPTGPNALFALVDRACRGDGNPLLTAVEDQLRGAGLI